MEIFNEKIVRMIRLYLSGVISEEERQELERWVEESEGNRRFFEEMKEEGRFAEEFPEFCRIDMEKGWRRFEQQVQPKRRSLWRRALRYAAVIAVPVAVGLSVWLLNREEKAENTLISKVIEPGQVKAMLVLPGGATLALQDMKQGEIEVDKGLKARQTNKGLVYDNDVVSREEKLKYNTLKTPRGGEFRLTLSDGTSVILNSATNLRYPVTFGKQERKVYLDGEAYFEVVRNTGRPFIVYTPDDEQVEVLGTKFYVEAYSGTKKFETALIEGSVRVRAANSQFILQPAYKAGLKGGKMSVEKITDFDIYRWREGLICFKNRHFSEILEELKKYYGVHIGFDAAKINNPVLTVKFRLSDGIEYALRVLQKDVKFKYVRNDEENTFVIK